MARASHARLNQPDLEKLNFTEFDFNEMNFNMSRLQYKSLRFTLQSKGCLMPWVIAESQQLYRQRTLESRSRNLKYYHQLRLHSDREGDGGSSNQAPSAAAAKIAPSNCPV